MGTIYRRGGILWVGFTDADGQRVYRSTNLPVGELRAAKRLLSDVEAEVQRGKRQAKGLPTVASYLESWLKKREGRVATVRLERMRLTKFVVPELGAYRLDEVGPLMVRQLVNGHRNNGMASRTLVNLYGILRRAFKDAVANQLITASPCVLESGELPARADVDPKWRVGALFSRAEAEKLLSPAVSLQHRIGYGLGLLAGLRLGEVSALRWRDYDESQEPLGALLIHQSYNRELKRLKGTKTGRAREVPVHPTLAVLLAQWKLQRKPKPDELLLPTATGGHLTDGAVLFWRRQDFKALGLRHRRFHDMRRTMISLARSDGARDDVLKTVTHGRGSEVIDDYTEFTWETRCEAVMALRLLPGKAVQVKALQKQLQAAGGGVQVVAIPEESGSTLVVKGPSNGRRHYRPPPSEVASF